MIAYWVGHLSLTIEPRQVVDMTSTGVVLQGANRTYWKSRTYGGQRYFLTYDEARDFIIAREQEKIRFFENMATFYRHRLTMAPPALDKAHLTD